MKRLLPFILLVYVCLSSCSQDDDIVISDSPKIIDPEATLFTYRELFDERTFVFLTSPTKSSTAVKEVTYGQSVSFKNKELGEAYDSYNVHIIRQITGLGVYYASSFMGIFENGSEYPSPLIQEKWRNDSAGYFTVDIQTSRVPQESLYGYTRRNFSNGNLNEIRNVTEFHTQPSFSYFQHTYGGSKQQYYASVQNVTSGETVVLSDQDFKKAEDFLYINPNLSPWRFISLEGIKNNIDYNITNGRFSSGVDTIYYPRDVFDHFSYAYYFENATWTQSSMEGETKTIEPFRYPEIQTEVSNEGYMGDFSATGGDVEYNVIGYLNSLDNGVQLYGYMISSELNSYNDLGDFQEKLLPLLEGHEFDYTRNEVVWLELIDLPSKKSFSEFLNSPIKEPYYLLGRRFPRVNESNTRYLTGEHNTFPWEDHEFWKPL